MFEILVFVKLKGLAALKMLVGVLVTWKISTVIEPKAAGFYVFYASIFK